MRGWVGAGSVRFGLRRDWEIALVGWVTSRERARLVEFLFRTSQIKMGVG